jgi:hypothetical protein
MRCARCRVGSGDVVFREEHNLHLCDACCMHYDETDQIVQRALLGINYPAIGVDAVDLL